MTIAGVTMTLCNWLNAEVCPEINLKLPNDDDQFQFELVHPRAYAGTAPPVTEDGENRLPWIVVMPVSGSSVGTKTGSDDGDTGKISIYLDVVTYNPGLHMPDGIVTDAPNEAWLDLVNTIDALRRAIENAGIIGGKLKIEYPVSFSVYDERDLLPNDRDYYRGSIEFDVSYPNVRSVSYDALLR